MIKKIFFLGLFILKLSLLPSFSITYTVSNTADAGAGSLRQAILDANANPGLDTIAFNGPFSIVLVSALPNITSPVFMNGPVTTGPQIEIDGTTNSIAGAGLLLAASASGSTIRGVNIHGFSGQGILIAASNISVNGCYIGTNLTGNSSKPNGLAGIEMAAALTNIKIGGSTPDSSNVISGNGALGINIAPTCNIIKICGNKIGTNANGTAGLPNAQSGLLATNVSNLIIGGGKNERNIISANAQNGIIVNNSSNVLISGNYVGVNSSGIVALGNGQSGMQINNSVVKIGGVNSDSMNVVSANPQMGIDLINTTGALLFGNMIGVGADGVTALGNGVHGIQVTGCTNTTIGGFGTQKKNVISCNNTHGILLNGGSNSIIQGNYIGTDKTGLVKKGNASHGIQLQGTLTGTIIGGRRYLEGNIISCNRGSGINFEDFGAGKVNANGTVINGNLIGTDSTTTQDFGNNVIGIIVKSDNCVIGSRFNNKGNVIAGTDILCGLLIANGDNNLIEGNFIGVGLDGTTAIPNTGDGILIAVENAGLTAANNKVIYNTIAYNFRYGVNIGAALNSNINNSETGNVIRFNSIFCNKNLGIFINKGNAADWGNNGQKSPGINFVLSTANVIVGVTDPTLAGKKIDIYEVIDCPSCDINPQGKKWIDSTTVTGIGSWSYDYFAKFGAPIPGQMVATVTDNANNTSEFSLCCTALSGITMTPSANPVCPGTTFSILYQNGQKGDSLMLQSTLNPLAGPWTNVKAALLTDPILFSSLTIIDTTYFRFITFSQGSFSAAACMDTSLILRIDVSIPPVAGTAKATPDTLCAGQTTTLLLTGQTGTIQWQESMNGGSFADLTGKTTNSFTDAPVSSNSPVQYRAALSGAPCPTVYSNVVQVIVPKVASGSISGPAKICNGDSTTFSLANFTGLIQWQDSVAGISWATIPGATAATLSYKPSATVSSDYVRVLIKDASGKCSAVSNPFIVVSDTCTAPLPIKIPNALTANGDGSNDVFYIYNIWLYPNNKLTVYNRWGSMVYETDGYVNNWDGTHKGEKLPVATYYYVLDLGKDINGNLNSKNKYSGSVTILR
jgi:gliding motility-associated-like protein